MKKNIIVFIVMALLLSCKGPTHKLTGDYVVYPEGEQGKGHYIMCNQGCPNNFKIVNVKFLLWNGKYIIIDQGILNNNNDWYIIKAEGNELKCCDHDKMIGPLTVTEMQDYIKENTISNLASLDFQNMPM